MEPDTDETRGTEPDILATTIFPMIPMNQGFPLNPRMSPDSCDVGHVLSRSMSSQSTSRQLSAWCDPKPPVCGIIGTQFKKRLSGIRSEG